MRSLTYLACALLLSLSLLGCGGRSAPSSGGGGAADSQAPAPDMGPPNLCLQVTGTCAPSCPASAPAFKYPPVSNACGAGKLCCVANCVSPPGTCNTDSQCKGGTVCSTSLGECGADPCCPLCAACYGKCVVQDFFATVTKATAGANMMPPSTGEASVGASMTLKNTKATAHTGVTIKGGIIGLPMGPMVYDLTLTPAPPFTGTVPAKGEVTVTLLGHGKKVPGSTPVPCNKKVYVRVDVGFGPGKTLRVNSPEITFGCVH